MSVHAIPDEEPDLLAGVRNGAWLDAQVFPPLRYHLPGIVPEGFALLVGPPKIGKSWFVLMLGLGVACGGRALNLQVEQRPVLYLALEDGHRRLQDRCRLLLAGDAIPPAFEYVTAVEPGTAIATIRAWLAAHDESLVILDTLGKVMPPAHLGESSYQRDYRVGSALKRAVDDHPGASVIVNHHDRKAGSDDFVDRVSGTNGLAGAADTIIVLTRERHEASALLNVTGRDIAEGEYAITFDGAAGLWMLDGPDLTTAAARAVSRKVSEGLGDRSSEVLAFVAEHPHGVRAKELQMALGIEEAQASVYLGRLYKSKRLDRPSRGLYTPVGSVGSVGFPDGS